MFLHLIVDYLAKLQFARMNGLLWNCVCRNQGNISKHDFDIVRWYLNSFYVQHTNQNDSEQREWFVSLENLKRVNKEIKILQEGPRRAECFVLRSFTVTSSLCFTVKPSEAHPSRWHLWIDYLNIESASRIRLKLPNFYALQNFRYLAWLISAMGKGTQGSITLKMANYLSDSTWCHL